MDHQPINEHQLILSYKVRKLIHSKSFQYTCARPFELLFWMLVLVIAITFSFASPVSAGFAPASLDATDPVSPPAGHGMIVPIANQAPENTETPTPATQLEPQPEEQVEPPAPVTPTRTRKPTATPVPIPPPSDPAKARMMIGFGVLAVLVIIIGVWINRHNTF